jgi:DNA-binding NarL/FixJ family response regulator
MISNRRPRAVLADDHNGVLSKLVDLLADEYDIVASVNDGAKAVQAASMLRPDVVILDMAMPHRNGMQAAQEIKRLGLKSKIVFLTIQEDLDYIRAACALGASYVLKARMPSDLSLAIKEALAGRVFVSPQLSVNLAADPGV